MNSVIPAFTSSTYNIRGLHNYGRGQVARKRAKQNNAIALALKHDIAHFQETNLNSRENNHFKTFLQIFFYVLQQPHQHHRGGCDCHLTFSGCPL